MRTIIRGCKVQLIPEKSRNEIGKGKKLRRQQLQAKGKKTRETEREHREELVFSLSYLETLVFSVFRPTLPASHPSYPLHPASFSFFTSSRKRPPFPPLTCNPLPFISQF
ncbi:hypothetical protein J1N35_020546 [Gossypium stocksii]|uniref:Uncharacterized protein n=1 Tax=Gossypium stocksii TaxID=47602 RepID=A0A9D4A142_9ROSI|nr:hypothetical protein J1N35_020546 [Gossypium stocksii]